MMHDPTNENIACRPTVAMPSFRAAAITRTATICALAAVTALGAYYCLNGELNADEGFYLLASRLVTEGYRPFRDFGFTQTPLLPYANLPWLSLFGFSLTGIRLAGLAWTILTVSVGCIVLLRHLGWFAAFAFCFLLLASPGWLAFCVKGKTYALVGFCALVATVALLSKRNSRSRWAIFTIAAAAGVATRLPSLPFFAAGWIFLFFENKNSRDRLTGSVATILLAGLSVFLSMAGDWESFRFWILDFHLATGMERSFVKRFGAALSLAPAVWTILLIFTKASVTGRPQWKALTSLLAIWICLAVSIGPVAGYGEYATPFVPVAAYLASREFAPFLASRKPVHSTFVCLLALSIGWLGPPPLEKNILLTAAEAENFLRTRLPPSYKVIASMPEIPAATGHQVPLILAPGKFAVTEDFDETQAALLHLATPQSVHDVVNDPTSGALVFSPGWKWNFSWSVPTYGWMSDEGKNLIFGDISENYEMEFANDSYVIFVRKNIQESDGLPD